MRGVAEEENELAAAASGFLEGAAQGGEFGFAADQRRGEALDAARLDGMRQDAFERLSGDNRSWAVLGREGGGGPRSGSSL